MMTNRRSGAHDDLAATVARGLRRGTLALKDVLGLSDREMNAVAQAAEQLRRAGDLPGAVAVLHLLITHDPQNANTWRNLAALYHRLGEHALAVGCFEMTAVLEGRTASDVQTESASLEALGQPELARGFLARERTQLIAKE